MSESPEETLLIPEQSVSSSTTADDVAVSPLASSYAASANHYVDKLTMELMMNRSHYKKYLANTNPLRYQETQEKTEKIQRNRSAILEITETQLTEFIRHMHSTKYNTEVSDAFETYMNVCLKYLDDYPIDDELDGGKERFGGDDDDDDDVDMLFDDPSRKSTGRRTPARINSMVATLPALWGFQTAISPKKI